MKSNRSRIRIASLVLLLGLADSFLSLRRVEFSHSRSALFSKNKSSDGPVLVVGATGRVGRRVVRSLLDQNRNVRAVVRSKRKAHQVFQLDETNQPNLEIVEADLSRFEQSESVLDKAVEGCRSIISVSGAMRVASITDFLPWRMLSNKADWAPRDHPYYANFLCQRKLIELAEKHGVERFVRLTGLAIAYPSFNPMILLFNTILSFSNRWALLTEQALYKSKVKYVILRPGGLTDDERSGNTTNIQVDASGKLPFPARIGRTDVAELAISAADLSQNLPSYTLACRWCGEKISPTAQGFKEEGCATARDCIDTVVDSRATSPSPPPMKPYGIAVAMVVYTLGYYGSKLARMVWNLTVRVIGGY